jgi:hypothetical protein
VGSEDVPLAREANLHPDLSEADVLVTLANPLPMAVIGNPGRRPMTRSRRLANRRQLRYRWKKRTAKGGAYSGFKAVVHDKAGRRKKHKAPRGHRWAWTGRKGVVSIFRKGLLVATNPVNAIKNTIVTPITSLPRSIPALFKGSIVKNVGYAAGGAVAGLAGGNIVQGAVFGLLNKFAPSITANVMSNDIAKRVVGASFALAVGGTVAKFAIKDSGARASFVTGVAAAALVEAIFPGRFASLLANVPVIGPMLAAQASPVSGLFGLYGSNDALAAYVSAPGYQGVNGYVSAPGYQGVNGYVSAPGYQGVNGLGGPMDDAVAGLGFDPNQLAGGMGHLGEVGAMGSNMASHLDS